MECIHNYTGHQEIEPLMECIHNFTRMAEFNQINQPIELNSLQNILARISIKFQNNIIGLNKLCIYEHRNKNVGDLSNI